MQANCQLNDFCSYDTFLRLLPEKMIVQMSKKVAGMQKNHANFSRDRDTKSILAKYMFAAEAT